MPDDSIIIIGAGMAGLCAGCYARMNGYATRIFEKHSLPGGLCTAWKRGGYTIDGSVHFLIGSAPGGLFHQYWQEVGLVQGRQFIHHEALARLEGADGRIFTLYADPDRLYQHMLELSPTDRPVIDEFIRGLRFFYTYKPPIDAIPELMGPVEGLKLLIQVAPGMKTLQKWSRITLGEFSRRFQDPLLRQALRIILPEEFPVMLLMGSLAWQAQQNAGYPIGGSLPLALAVEQRFKLLGGEVHYHAPVAKILTENGRAVGVRLADGSEHRARTVISAADGYTTLFKLLGERHLDEKTRSMYTDFHVSPSMIYINFGVNRTFDEPPTVSGVVFPLETPTQLGDRTWDYLPVRIVNFDPTFAPPGKTVLTVSLWSDYGYWKKLSANPQACEAKKQEILQRVIGLLDRHWPGLAAQIEVTDVATPLTFERFTGNWQGSTQGWLQTPKTALLQMKKTLPGLKSFYMVGQWVEPGGGLPGAVRSARTAIRLLCHADKKRFSASIE